LTYFKCYIIIYIQAGSWKLDNIEAAASCQIFDSLQNRFWQSFSLRKNFFQTTIRKLEVCSRTGSQNTMNLTTKKIFRIQKFAGEFFNEIFIIIIYNRFQAE